MSDNPADFTRIRLFVEDDLATGAGFTLGRDQSHYLQNVMRRGVGDRVAIFNGRDGEVPAVGPPGLASTGGMDYRVERCEGHPEDVIVDLLLAAGVAGGTASGDRWSANGSDGSTVIVHGPGTVEHRHPGGTTHVVYVTPVDGFAVQVRSASTAAVTVAASDGPVSGAVGTLPGFRLWYRRFDSSSAPQPRPVRSGRRNRRDAPAG